VNDLGKIRKGRIERAKKRLKIEDKPVKTLDELRAEICPECGGDMICLWCGAMVGCAECDGDPPCPECGIRRFEGSVRS